MASTDRLPGWQPFAVGAVAVAAMTGLLAGTVPGPMRAVLLLLVLLTTVAGAYGGAFVGLPAGALCATVLLSLPEVTTLSAVPRTEVVAVTLLLVAAGWLAGLAHSQVGLAVRGATIVDHLFAPPIGSLGLLSAEAAELRAEEEMMRARHHERPLSLLLCHLDALPQTDRTSYGRARRAVARILESRLAPTAVPFELDDQTFGVLLPEIEATSLPMVVETIERALDEATFADRASSDRRSVLDVLNVGFAGVDGTERWSGPQAMIEAADRIRTERSEETLPLSGLRTA